MMDLILLYLGSGLTVIWGVIDNKRIVTMEWIIEGLALIFIGVLVATVTVIDPSSVVSTAIYFISVIMLLVMALLSLFTGFKVSFLPFKLCPFIFTTSAVLIMIGGLIIGGGPQ
jgi:hypothetical protein